MHGNKNSKIYHLSNCLATRECIPIPSSHLPPKPRPSRQGIAKQRTVHSGRLMPSRARCVRLVTHVLSVGQPQEDILTVRPFLRRFRRNSTKPCIESQREAQYLQKTLLEWAQSGDVSIGLLAPFDDDGQGETLKRFEQAFGRRASRFAPGIPGLTSCQLCSLSRSLTAADTCQERQPPQGHRYQPEAPCGLVVSLQRHRCAGEGPPLEPPQAPLHLIGPARGQHRVRQ